MKRIFIEAALLAQIIELLPQVSYDARWDLAPNSTQRPGVETDNPEHFSEGLVHATIDNEDRVLFIVCHNDELNYITQASDAEPSPDGTVQLFFNGSSTVAAVLETAADGGGVTLDALAAFFVFFGPESVAAVLKDVLAELDAADAAVSEETSTKIEADVELVGVGVRVANDESIDLIAQIAAVSPKSVDVLERLRAAHRANPRELPERTTADVTLLRLDTRAKRIGAGATVVGIAGLAIYGFVRLCRG